VNTADHDEVYNVLAERLGLDLRMAGLATSGKPVSAAIEDRLRALLALDAGWDGYRGTAMGDNVAARIRLLIGRAAGPAVATPSIVPGPPGDAQVEWHVRGVDLEIVVRAEGDVDVSLEIDGAPMIEWSQALPGATA
jgi:hypothetical protein